MRIRFLVLCLLVAPKAFGEGGHRGVIGTVLRHALTSGITVPGPRKDSNQLYWIEDERLYSAQCEVGVTPTRDTCLTDVRSCSLQNANALKFIEGELVKFERQAANDEKWLREGKPQMQAWKKEESDLAHENWRMTGVIESSKKEVPPLSKSIANIENELKRIDAKLADPKTTPEAKARLDAVRVDYDRQLTEQSGELAHIQKTISVNETKIADNNARLAKIKTDKQHFMENEPVKSSAIESRDFLRSAVKAHPEIKQLFLDSVSYPLPTLSKSESYLVERYRNELITCFDTYYSNARFSLQGCTTSDGEPMLFEVPSTLNMKINRYYGSETNKQSVERVVSLKRDVKWKFTGENLMSHSSNQPVEFGVDIGYENSAEAHARVDQREIKLSADGKFFELTLHGLNRKLVRAKGLEEPPTYDQSFDCTYKMERK